VVAELVCSRQHVCIHRLRATLLRE
jgi:hypothetical protein